MVLHFYWKTNVVLYSLKVYFYIAKCTMYSSNYYLLYNALLTYFTNNPIMKQHTVYHDDRSLLIMFTSWCMGRTKSNKSLQGKTPQSIAAKTMTDLLFSYYLMALAQLKMVIIIAYKILGISSSFIRASPTDTAK